MIQPLPCYRIHFNHKDQRYYVGPRCDQWPNVVCLTAWEARFHLLSGAPVVWLLASQLEKFRKTA